MQLPRRIQGGMYSPILSTHRVFWLKPALVAQTREKIQSHVRATTH